MLAHKRIFLMMSGLLIGVSPLQSYSAGQDLLSNVVVGKPELIARVVNAVSVSTSTLNKAEASATSSSSGSDSSSSTNTEGSSSESSPDSTVDSSVDASSESVEIVLEDSNIGGFDVEVSSGGAATTVEVDSISIGTDNDAKLVVIAKTPEKNVVTMVDNSDIPALASELMDIKEHSISTCTAFGMVS